MFHIENNSLHKRVSVPHEYYYVLGMDYKKQNKILKITVYYGKLKSDYTTCFRNTVNVLDFNM
jgi:hypothetical protein